MRDDVVRRGGVRGEGIKISNHIASYSRYSIDTLMYKWHRYLRGSDYTYLLDNCFASSVYLRNLECGLSSRGEAADCDGLPFACGNGGDLLRCDVGGDEELRLGPPEVPWETAAAAAAAAAAADLPMVNGSGITPSLTKCILDR